MTTNPTVNGSQPPVLANGGQPFYVTGGTLPVGATSYVERSADTALLSALQRGEFCYVLDTRQMGKSSLMARTAGLLRQSGASVAVLDLTSLGQNLSVAQWYNGLLASVGEQLDVEEATEDYWSEHRDAGPMQRFLGALRDVVLDAVPSDLVIFIDEIDAVRSLPFSTGELFAGIRELYNRRTQDPELRRLTFCLLGVATPADLIRDIRTTPFNIGSRIDLSDFTLAEAAPLTQGMTGGRAVLDRVLYWTGGHPYLTQRLCRAIADDPAAITKPAQVDALCERLFLSQRARETEDNLLFVRDRVLRTELELAALLTIHAKVVRGRPAVADDPADPLVSALKLAGVVKADASGRLRVRNRIYRHVFGRAWVQENMPGAEVRRQRRAFRRGALRTGLVAAVIIAIIGTLAGIAVREAHKAEQETRRAQKQTTRFEKLLYVSDMQNAQTAWDDGNLGRLRALLAQTKASPERGFEWGYWNRLAYPSGKAVQVGTTPLVACDATQDGKTLLTADVDGMIRLWDARTLRPLYSVRYPGPAIYNAYFSTDGSRWLANDHAGGLVIYDTRSGRRLFSLLSDKPNFGSFTGADMKFAVQRLSDVGATFLNCDTGKKVGFLPLSGGDTAVTPANAHNKVFWFNPKPLIDGVYDLTNGRRICRLQLPPRLQSAVTIQGAFSNDDRTLVTLSWAACDYDMWDAASGRLIRHLANVPYGDASFFTVDPYAPLVLIRDNARLREYSTQTGQQLLDCPYPETSGELSPSRFSRDGRFLGFVGATGEIFLLDCKTGKSAGTYLGHTAASVSVAFLPQSNRFISVSADGSLRRWDRRSAGQQPWHTVRFPRGVTYDLMTLLPAQSRAVLWEKTVRCSLWDISADCARRIRYLDTVAGAQNASLNTNDTTVFAWPTSGGVFTEYDLEDGHIVGVWKGDGSDTSVAAVSPDGRYLASYSQSGMTSVFDRLGNTRLWSVRGSNSVANVLAFSPSGRLVASRGLERAVDVRDAHTGRSIAMLSGSTGTIFFVTILPGDRHLAAACEDGTMRCWDIASGRLLWAVQTTQSSTLQHIADGSRLLTTSQSGVVSLWDAETGDRLLKINSNGRASDARFSPDGSTLELSNSVGGYANYAADMRPHDVPVTESVGP